MKRINSTISGLSSSVRKVFDQLEFQTAKTAPDVLRGLKNAGIERSLSDVVGTLNYLVSLRLAHCENGAVYTRVAAEEKPRKKEEPVQQTDNTQETISKRKPGTTPRKEPPAPEEDIMTRIGEVSSRIRKLRAEMDDLAASLEQLAVEAQIHLDKNANDAEDLRRIRRLLGAA